MNLQGSTRLTPLSSLLCLNDSQADSEQSDTRCQCGAYLKPGHN